MYTHEHHIQETFLSTACPDNTLTHMHCYKDLTERAGGGERGREGASEGKERERPREKERESEDE